MIGYKTVASEARAEQVIEKSRFIARVKPVMTREEADGFVAAVGQEHREASHHVPAMVLGDRFQAQWASDDGEPSGTAGAPILRMLVQEGLTNVAVVVTRYFGGVKLGTGGLVRAYTGSAKLALEKAGIRRMQERTFLGFEIEYGFFNQIQAMARGRRFQIEETLYGEKVTLTVSAEAERAADLRTVFSEVTAGGAILVSEETKFAEIPAWI